MSLKFNVPEIGALPMIYTVCAAIEIKKYACSVSLRATTSPDRKEPRER